MRAEAEGGADAEVAAAAPARGPEQIGVVVGIGAAHAAVGIDHLQLEQVVDRQTVLSDQRARAASQGESGDARGGAEAARHHQPLGTKRLIEGEVPQAGLHRGDAAPVVHLHPVISLTSITIPASTTDKPS